jgi:hypothetical protein
MRFLPSRLLRLMVDYVGMHMAVDSKAGAQLR